MKVSVYYFKYIDNYELCACAVCDTSVSVGFWDISYYFLQRNFPHVSPLLEQAIPVQDKERTGAVAFLYVLSYDD